MSHDDEYSTGTALLLWLGCVFGLAGIHRFYLGKPASGLLYLFTWGLFGMGSFVDLIRMRSLVEDANIRQDMLAERAERRALRQTRRRQGQLPSSPSPVAQLASGGDAPTIVNDDDMRLILIRAAAKNNGSLSVTQGVLATGKPFAEVEQALDTMAKSGYVDIGNAPDSGVLIYKFRQLS